MFNHTPKDYICPICLAVKGTENKDTLIYQSDIIYQDKFILVFISSFFIGKIPGHLIIVPKEHCENLYDLPSSFGAHIFKISQKMAKVMKKVYQCEGITTIQNNEPAANQHAFHYHLHIFPRYSNDNLYSQITNKRLTAPEERNTFANKIKKELVKSNFASS